MRHRQLLDRFPVPYVTLVNGSFVTTKSEPNDVDLVVLFEAEVANGMPAQQKVAYRQALDRRQARSQYSLDLFAVGIHRFATDHFVRSSLPSISYWTRVFGIDRMGRQKAILVVTGGGVL